MIIFVSGFSVSNFFVISLIISSSVNQNNITVAYEAVHYSRGRVSAGSEGEPTGFGDASHYDRQPSPISLLGGGQLGIDGIFGAGADLYDYISQGENFGSPLEAALGAFQLIINISNSKSKIIFLDFPENDPKIRRPKLNRIKNEFNWEAEVELKEGLEKTIKYFKGLWKKLG